MIKKKTTFVLGAGAHCPYGFPDGETLKKRIIGELQGGLSPGAETNFKYIVGRGLVAPEHLSRDNVERFIEALQMSGHASIDSFLNAYKDKPGYKVIGKAAIAQALHRTEIHADIFNERNDDDWLRYLFREMLEGASDPDVFAKGNQVGFVTFNYDRTLERWLHEKIRFSFDVDHVRSSEILKSIPIFHVYGSLSGHVSKPSDKDIGFDWVDSCQGLRLIYEVEQNPKILEVAKVELFESEVICLLGFGFHEDNINALTLEKVFAHGVKNLAASRYGITDAEWDRKTTRLSPGRIQRSDASARCLATLRNVKIF